jgi:hypothetical protein
LVRRRRSRESDAGSGKRRLIFCPSPFAAARLPFASPSSLPSFLSALARFARPIPSPCPSRSSPSYFALLPRLSLAFSRPSLCWTGFPCGHSRGKPCPPGLFGLAQPGPRRERSRGVSVFHRVVGLAPGNPDRSRRWIPPGPGGPKAARRPQGRVTVLVAVLVTVLVTVLAAAMVAGTGQAGGRSGASGFPRAAPWEKASLTSGSGEQDQNPGTPAMGRCVRGDMGGGKRRGRGQMAEARPIPEGPESPRRSPQPRRATALVAVLVTNSSQNPASGCSILGLWTTCLGGEDRWGFRS